MWQNSVFIILFDFIMDIRAPKCDAEIKELYGFALYILQPIFECETVFNSFLYLDLQCLRLEVRN